MVSAPTGAGFSAYDQKPPPPLTTAEEGARRDALDQCYRRTIPPGGRSGQIAWKSGLQNFEQCMRGLGFHVRVFDQPAKNTFGFAFSEK